MNIRQGIALSGIVTALAAGVGAATAFAAVPIPAADGKIRACVKYEDINKYEQMRWITTATCPKGEKLITWNAKGVRGPKGDVGPAGPPGTNGTNGSDGAPGATRVFFTSDQNVGHNPNYRPHDILSLNVPDGSYAVTATVEVRNFKNAAAPAECSIGGFTPTLRHVVVAPNSSVVLTVIGTKVSDAGKLKLVCNGLPLSDDINGPRFDDPAIMATKTD